MSYASQNGDGGRLRTAKVATTAEEKAIQNMMDKGEQDLALKREARARARKLRLEELQRQKESEEQSERESGASFRLKKMNSSRVELEDDLPLDPAERLVAINNQLKETLLLNSQLHSDKMQLVYQLDLFKDRLEDIDQDLVELRHYNRTTKQDLAVSQHHLQLNEQQVKRLQQEADAREAYMKEKSIEWPPPEKPEEEHASAGEATPSSLTSEVAMANGDLSRASSSEDVSGDDKKRRVDAHTREKQYLLEQIGRLKQEVILLKNELESQALSSAATENGGSIGGRELMRDTARLLSEYKSKLLAVETDKTRLDGQLQRADAQVKRLRTQREDAEKLEDELKSERRKLQREVRETKSKAEELELENERLQKRVEALRKRHQ